MQTIATLFSGGEGVGVGGKSVGLRPLWGIEIDDAIAQVARDNGFAVETADILRVNPADYETPTVLHASPPCPSFSLAKQGRRETAYDISLAKATARFIEELRPQFFTLENVYGYRKSKSWAIIADTLNRCGYWYDLAHVNAADAGVPQTRKRMIVRAALGQMVPPLPPPEPWIGWYDSIRDLIPTLPESQLADWQERGLGTLWDLPAQAGTTLIDSAGYPDENEVIILVTRRADEPANTVVASHARRPMRAFLVGGQYGGPFDDVRRLRPVQVRMQDEPAFTVTAQNKGDWRAWLAQGRVVQMTPRALARFQSFSDSYILPDDKRLACRVIGMAVPPLLFQRLVGQLVRELR